MTRELITSWGDYQTAVDRLLGIAGHKICIYDEDLGQLKLDSPPRLAEIRRVLQAEQPANLQIIVRNAEPLRSHSPLLLKLLSDFGHLASAQQSPEDLAHLRDSMLIIDDTHALIRFEQDLPRSKLLINEANELKTYRARFAELCLVSGEFVGNSTLGL